MYLCLVLGWAGDKGHNCDVLSSGVNFILVEVVEGSQFLLTAVQCSYRLRFRSKLESIQGTCRLSLKMSRGDEQKTCHALYETVINIDFRSSNMPPLPNNGTFKSICWTFASRLNIFVSCQCVAKNHAP